MGFIEAFIECMQGAGVPDATGVPQDENALRSAIDGIKGIVGQMDDGAKEMLKELTTNEKNNDLFVQAGAGGAEGLAAMFDGAQGWDFDQLLQYCDYCFEQAQAAAGQEGGEQEGGEYGSEEYAEETQYVDETESTEQSTEEETN